MQASASRLVDSERGELESVLEALTRTPRLAKLLAFLAERYFTGKADEISEYNIATEVFGRSKTTFDPSQDSIARVEAYRLRKKLKEYYEADGKEHQIQISLPPGSYVPTFTRRVLSPQRASIGEPQASADDVGNSVSLTLADAEETLVSSPRNVVETKPGETRAPRKLVLYSIAGVAALLLVLVSATRFIARSKSGYELSAVTSHPFDATRPPTPNAAQVPMRLLAGYDGTPRIDSAGAYWQADRYFHGGAAFRRPDVPVARTSDPMLFEHWRTGDFTYDIPLAPGPYEVHLYFVASLPEDFKTSFFNVNANGQPLLKSFNISSDALGANVADERVFKDVYPDKDGFLHLSFSMERSSPSLNAIEILPGLSHRQLPVRIVTQQAAVTDHDGNLWHSDNYFQNGSTSDPPKQVSGTPDPNLYEQERYGHFTYSIPVDTRGRYTLVLHFAELYWVPQASGSGVAGSRVFKIYCNGSTLLDNFDILKEAGSLHALTKTFYHLRPTAEGKLDLTFEPIVNYATVSAIEVIDESE
jgi:Malectin domain